MSLQLDAAPARQCVGAAVAAVRTPAAVPAPVPTGPAGLRAHDAAEDPAPPAVSATSSAAAPHPAGGVR